MLRRSHKNWFIDNLRKKVFASTINTILYVQNKLFKIQFNNILKNYFYNF